MESILYPSSFSQAYKKVHGKLEREHYADDERTDARVRT
jgi:hypothetical protein